VQAPLAPSVITRPACPEHNWRTRPNRKLNHCY